MVITEDRPLLVATGNPGKVVELRRLFDWPIALAAEAGVPWESPEETGSTYSENALLKAQSLGELVGRPAIGEDAGLEVEGLGGAPGLYSARYGPDTARRNHRLLHELAAAEDDCGRRARFVCTLALWRPNAPPEFFTGELRGKIASEATGTGGFGYDPLFLPEGESRSLADLGAEFKDRCSHRARAVRALVAWGHTEMID